MISRRKLGTNTPSHHRLLVDVAVTSNNINKIFGLIMNEVVLMVAFNESYAR